MARSRSRPKTAPSPKRAWSASGPRPTPAPRLTSSPPPNLRSKIHESKETTMKVEHGFLVGVACGLFLLLGTSATICEAQEAAAPKQVYVVNTGDGTVSLVDLTSMKE